MKTFKELLKNLGACSKAIEWAGDKTIEEVVEQCYRGDWLLWLADRVGIGLQSLTLAKGHCANTIRNLVTDERSIRAIDTAIAFGEGKATREELYISTYSAYVAYRSAADDAAAHAAYVAYAAAAAADDADSSAADAHAASYVVASFVSSAADVTTAKKENQMLTADVCREYIGNLIIDKVNKLLNTK